MSNHDAEIAGVIWTPNGPKVRSAPRTFGGPVNCPRCGASSWNAAAHPGEPCLPCKRPYSPASTPEEG